MKSYLKGLFLFAAIALLFLLTGCDPTPDLQPTVEALVEQRLAEVLAATPNPTPLATFSKVEAISRLRWYFETKLDEEQSFATEVYGEALQRFVLSESEPPGGYGTLGSYIFADRDMWVHRQSGDMTADYQGQGIWLITVGPRRYWSATAAYCESCTQQLLFERWLLLESGDIPPQMCQKDNLQEQQGRSYGQAPLVSHRCRTG